MRVFDLLLLRESAFAICGNMYFYTMKKKECPSCAMEIEAKSKVCPICQYELPAQNNWVKWLAIAMVILFMLYLILL